MINLFDKIIMVVEMVLYLVSNNLVIDDIVYETDETLEEKRINRPLSIEGEKMAVKLVKKIKANIVYSSSYASSIASAKYFASVKKCNIVINSFLNDLRVGDLGNRNIQMLRFMQERNFDFKFNRGESLSDVNKRMNIAIDRILKKNSNKNIVIFTQKSAITGYLLDKLEKGYNLDDRLILSFNDKVIIDDANQDVNIIKICFEKGKIIDCDAIEMEK
ncbi:histidine phosphatase family protein [bacterium]|jgi:broad specificity phosphatase PhoE|nr:histidine phosphatase family protein [bacterium]